MFIDPTINWVPSGFSGYIWLDTKIVLKRKKKQKKTLELVFVRIRFCSPNCVKHFTHDIRNETARWDPDEQRQNDHRTDDVGSHELH